MIAMASCVAAARVLSPAALIVTTEPVDVTAGLVSANDVAALMMPAAGSVSVPGKNVRSIAGKPLVAYPIEAALASKLLDSVYVTTDCPQIKDIAISYGVKVIDRPFYLSQANSEMSEGVVHAQGVIHADILVTMHANCGIHREGLIDECITRLIEDDTLDSCVSARDVADMHPYRLKKVQEDGTLTTWVEMPNASNNRQAIKEKAVVLDGACRAFRTARCLPPNGQPPFKYLGHRIGWVENEGGLDVHSEADILVTEQWMKTCR